MEQSAIYLDNNASTPPDPRVLEVVHSTLLKMFGNASSTTHDFGRQAADVVERSRAEIAALAGCSPGEIIFTSGATESNNLVILGLAEAAPASRRRIISTQIEHKSVLGPIEELVRRGFEARLLGVDRRGRVDLDQLEDELRTGAFLVSVQAANSEVGTRQDIAQIAKLAHEYGAALHSDAVQALGKVDVSASSCEVDFLSFNAHKLYGPKGIGAVFMRGGARSWPIRPLMFGGNQEHGLRPGTLDVPAIAGFGEAARIAMLQQTYEMQMLTELRDEFEHQLQSSIGDVRINGDRSFRLPGTTSVTFSGVDAEALLARCHTVAASTASACNSGALEPSHVLLAMGLPRDEAYQTVRFAFGRFSNLADAINAASQVTREVRSIQGISTTA